MLYILKDEIAAVPASLLDFCLRNPFFEKRKSTSEGTPKHRDPLPPDGGRLNQRLRNAGENVQN